MRSVVDIRTFFSPGTVPTLVLLDMQQEYVANDRLLAVAGCKEALDNCRRALSHARQMDFPVAFVRWTESSTFFNLADQHHRWIEGFEPRGSDMVFDRELPSCFSSKLFEDVMVQSGAKIVLAGFSGEAACLSTIIDAFHKRVDFIYLADASASHDLAGTSGEDVHYVLQRIVQLYGPVADTRSWIENSSIDRGSRIARA